MDEQLPHFGHGQISHDQSEVAARPWTLLVRFYPNIFKSMTCSSCCNYSLCTPDDGCGRHPKHMEWLGSKTDKDSLELHLVGLLNALTYDTRKYEHKLWTKISVRNNSLCPTTCLGTYQCQRGTVRLCKSAVIMTWILWRHFALCMWMWGNFHQLGIYINSISFILYLSLQNNGSVKLRSTGSGEPQVGE